MNMRDERQVRDERDMRFEREMRDERERSGHTHTDCTCDC